MFTVHGCAWLNTQTSSGPAATAPPAAATAGATPSFHDFQDIPIPSELTLVAKESTVFQGGAVKGGMLTFKGRVEPTSVVNFFMVALARENWKHRGDIRYRKSVLLFEKPDRFCIISIRESTYHTYVELYVVPTSAGTHSSIPMAGGDTSRADSTSIKTKTLQ